MGVQPVSAGISVLLPVSSEEQILGRPGPRSGAPKLSDPLARSSRVGKRVFVQSKFGLTLAGMGTVLLEVAVVKGNA